LEIVLKKTQMDALVLDIQKNLIEERGVSDSSDLMMLYTRLILNTLDMIDKQVGRDVSLDTMDRMIDNLKISRDQLSPVREVADVKA